MSERSPLDQAIQEAEWRIDLIVNVREPRFRTVTPDPNRITAVLAELEDKRPKGLGVLFNTKKNAVFSVARDTLKKVQQKMYSEEIRIYVVSYCIMRLSQYDRGLAERYAKACGTWLTEVEAIEREKQENDNAFS